MGSLFLLFTTGITVFAILATPFIFGTIIAAFGRRAHTTLTLAIFT